VQIDESPSKSNHKSELTIQDLYPELDEEQRKEAEVNLTRYAEIIFAIFQEQRSASFDIQSSSTRMKERSNKSLKN